MSSVLIAVVAISAIFIATDPLMGSPLPACSDLPSRASAETAFRENPETVADLQALIGIRPEIVSPKACPTRAGILIYYGGTSDLKRVRELIGDDFFGIPYGTANV